MKKIVLLIVLFVLIFLVSVAYQPAQFSISREMVIAAPAEKIFPYINNSKLANSWMPWQESDPGAVMSYSGPDEGVGSTSSWDSKGQMGTGKAVVVESLPSQRVITQLTYSKPMEMSQRAEIQLVSEGSGTRVRWTVMGQNTFIGKLICTIMRMDKMVGSQFEKGLTKLRTMVEASGK